MKIGLILFLVISILWCIRWLKGSPVFDQLVLGQLRFPRGFQKRFKDTRFSNIFKNFAQMGQSHLNVPIQVVSRCYLDQKKSLLVAQVGNRQFFLGVTESSIGFLADLNSNVANNTINTAPQEHEKTPLFHENNVEPSMTSKNDPEWDEVFKAESLGVRSRIRNRLEGLKPL